LKRLVLCQNRWVFVVILVCLCGTLFLPAQQPAEASKQDLALIGARIYTAPDAPVIPHGTVLIEGGKITAVGPQNVIRVPKQFRKLSCDGKTITAGFWNSHVHFTEPKWQNSARTPAAQLTTQLQQMLTRYGFTSVVDTGSNPADTTALRKRINSGEIAGPRILTAGTPLYPENGIPYYVLESIPPNVVKLLKQPATPEEAVRAVDDDIAQGADIIKLFVVSWVSRNGKHVPLPMRPDIVKAAVDEAHRRGKLVFAHPSTIAGVQLVLQGHVDVLAHTIEGPDDWTPSVVQRLKAENVSLIPTLALFNSPTEINQGILNEVKTYADAGGTILFGTDIGYLTNYPDLTREFDLLSRAGLTFPRVLESLTTAPALRLGFEKTSGRIAKGLDADLVVMDGDPGRDVMAFSRVTMTIRKGQIIYESPPH
jgi:imidazolonepropionase-like amidohydrolase